MHKIRRLSRLAFGPLSALLALLLTALPMLAGAALPQVQAAPLPEEVARSSDWVPLLQVAPSSVRVTGPRTVYVGDTHAFTATVYPADVTLPITHTWQATDQSTISVSRPYTTSSVHYSWSTPGTKYIPGSRPRTPTG